MAYLDVIRSKDDKDFELTSSNKILNLEAIRSLNLFEYPYQWGFVSQVFLSSEIGERLSEEFPVDSYIYRQYLGGSYCRRPFIQLGALTTYNPSGLSNLYLQLARVLLSSEYKMTLGEAIGVDLTDAPMEASFWRYNSDTNFNNHDDFETKIVTQVLYINNIWKKEFGGSLQILGSNDAKDIAFELTPYLGLSSIIMQSTDRSWHTISPVADSAPESRNTITIQFHQPGTKASRPDY